MGTTCDVCEKEHENLTPLIEVHDAWNCMYICKSCLKKALTLIEEAENGQ